jgi:hypothetical protein
MKRTLPTLLVFIDGLGLGSRDALINPLYGGSCPHLAALLDEHAQPVDTCLGVAGLPQSATGQTALLTGINASQAVGRHVEGFPTPALRKMIGGYNIFRRLHDRGLKSTFANGYFVNDTEEVRQAHMQSVTTVAALSAFDRVRTREDIESDRAVYHDLTRRSLQARGYAGPFPAPAQAAAHLVALTLDHDLTLFEYFQTDRAGHRRAAAATQAVLAHLDEFVAALASEAEKRGYLLVLTSDHGNVEDNRSGLHTLNPVPFIAVGEGGARLQQKVASLTDVTPALVENICADV